MDVVRQEMQQGARAHTYPQRNFFLGVEHGQINCHAWKQATFDKAQEQSQPKQAGIVLNQTGHCCNDAPACGYERDPSRRSKFLEQQVRRYFTEEICNEQNRDGRLILISTQPEILL
jgi:hypothetical protein